MKALGLVILTLLLISPVMAIGGGFSPTSITSDAVTYEEVCRTVYFWNTENASSVIDDKWAPKEDTEWKVSLFTSDTPRNLIVSYPVSVSADEKKAEICFTAKKAGIYRGVILISPEPDRESCKKSRGYCVGSAVRFGIWVKLNITEDELESDKSLRKVSITSSQEKDIKVGECYRGSTVEKVYKYKSNGRFVTRLYVRKGC